MSTSGEQWLTLVEQVAVMPEVIAAMLREHAPTPEGRCATCHVDRSTRVGRVGA